MTPFLTAMLNSSDPVGDEKKADKPTPTTECQGCGGSASSNVVAKAGMEEGQNISKLQGDAAEVTASKTEDAGGTTTIATRGPLGLLITEALNKKLHRTQVHGEFQTGLEDLDPAISGQVQANGQVLPEPTPQSVSIARTRIMTGVLPPIDDANTVTCLNAAIQAMGAVRSVEYVFVHDSSLGKNPTQAEVELTGSKAVPMESAKPAEFVNAAIESVQIIVRLKDK